MCSIFSLQTTNKQIEQALGLQETQFPSATSTRFTVGQLIPVLIAKPEGIQCREMRFGLIPSWSDTPRPKFATHNARLFAADSTPIFKKATWRGPFAKRHGLVAMTSFIEPIYTGEYAGKMISFATGETLFAATIWESWLNKETGELIDSTSILTDEPIDFVQRMGHDRSPVFLSTEAALQWTRLSADPSEMIEFLRTHRLRSNTWSVTVDREMKDGWQKRVPAR
jgi:putative SOS response-associated peptidase YedK